MTIIAQFVVFKCHFGEILVMYSLFFSQLELSFTFTSCLPIQIYIFYFFFLSAAISKMYLFSALSFKQNAGGVLVESVESLYPEQSSECCSSDLTCQ